MHTPTFLRTIPLFSNLIDSELAMVDKLLVEVAVDDGTKLIEEGKPNDRLFVILEGRVELRGQGEDGRGRTVAVLGVGEEFGESGMTPKIPSAVSAEVIMGPARLLTVKGDAIKHLVRNKPEIGIGLLTAAFARIQTLQRMSVLQG